MASNLQTDFQIQNGYAVKTDQFEGPFALLLELIIAEKLDISTISLAKVTRDFFEYLKSHDTLPVYELADFLVVGSQLLYIKSRTLLPEVVFSEDDATISLEKQLKMYKAFVDASHYIDERFESNARGFFGYIQTPKITRGFYPPSTVTCAMLKESIQRLVQRLTPIVALEKVHIEKVVSLVEKIERIKHLLMTRARMSFAEIIDKGGRLDTIVSFLAILELVKHRSVSVNQTHAFSDIMIEQV